MSARHGVQALSLVMILVSCTGIFLPLEVALNQAWGVTKSRNYLLNQLVAFGLAILMVVLAMGSVLLSTWQRQLLGFSSSITPITSSSRASAICGWRRPPGVASILFFFSIYWLLPNRKIPAAAGYAHVDRHRIIWLAAKEVFVAVLPHLDLKALYGPFYVSVGLLFWAYISGLILFAGAQFSAIPPRGEDSQKSAAIRYGMTGSSGEVQCCVRLRDFERLHRDRVWPAAGGQHGEHLATAARRRGYGAIECAHHGHVAGARIHHEQQMAGGRKCQRRRAVAHVNRANALAVVDGVDRDFLRVQVADVEQGIVGGDKAAHRIVAHQVRARTSSVSALISEMELDSEFETKTSPPSGLSASCTGARPTSSSDSRRSVARGVRRCELHARAGWP